MKRAKIYVGIDIGKRTCVACIMGADGAVLKRTKYPNTRKDVNRFIDGLDAYDCMAACESTARMWIKTYEEFERRGMPIILANPLRLKMAQSGVKTDRIDAEKLANKLRLDDIPACYVLGPEARRTMDILRQRMPLGSSVRITARCHPKARGGRGAAPAYAAIQAAARVAAGRGPAGAEPAVRDAGGRQAPPPRPRARPRPPGPRPAASGRVWLA